MSNKIYIGDIGTAIILEVGVEIQTATVTEILWKNPKGKTGIWTAELIKDDETLFDPLVDSAVVTKIRYVTVQDDIDTVGQWKVQAQISLSTWTGRGETAAFTVYDYMQ